MNQAQRPNGLAALADYFFERREAILSAWRNAVENDSNLKTASALSRRQFIDHIPSVLAGFERELRATDGAQARQAQSENKESAAEHGLQRWHRGYNQEDLMREWGHLHLSLLNELERYTENHPDVDFGIMRRARFVLAHLCNQGIMESTVKYLRLHQAEAASRLRDLERAQARIQSMDRERAAAWREAAHDLRNQVWVVNSVTENLRSVPQGAQEDYLTMLEESVASLKELLNDLAILSRLEAGHERRNLQQFDASAMLRDSCEAMRPLASERNLFLVAQSPGALVVEGDLVKVQRIAQNLILNAIKYTERGGVRVTLGAMDTGEVEQWELCVQDTGPGFQHAAVAPLARVLKEAGEEALKLEEGIQKETQCAPTLLAQSADGPADQEPGEGIGLSIVKRLSELLDASLELQTDVGKGTTFRLVFPRRYDDPPVTKVIP